MWLFQEVWSILAVSCLVAATTTSTLPESQGYKFGYTVQADETGDYKTHHEVSDGKEVRGSYSVGEPNGDLRVVTYTADRVNGFRALVKVHPGGSPVKPGAGAETTSASQQTSESVTEETYTTASSDSLTLNKGNNLTEVKKELKVLKVANNTRINHKPTLSRDESVTLFKVLPALDKHVPKVEYIVEQVLGGEEEEGQSHKKDDSELRNNEDELFEGSQIIPVKILEDPTNQSPEMVGLDENLDNGFVTTIANEDVIMTNNHEMNKSTLITDVGDIQNSSLQSLPVKDPTMLALHTVHTSSSICDDDKLITSNTQEIKIHTTPQQEITNLMNLKIDQPAIDKAMNETVQNNLKMKPTSSVTTQPMIQHTKDQKSTANTIKSMEMDKMTPIATQPTLKLATEEIKKAENEIPNKILLAALMFPTVPILKFTCHPDTNDQVDVKTTPTAPSQTAKLKNATPPKNPPKVIPLYPFQLLNFKPQKFTDFSPQNSMKLSPQPPLLGYGDFTTIPSTPFVNLRMLSQKPSTGPTTPQRNLDIPKPTQGFMRSVEHMHQTSMANRHHYPLYPIPPPWTYHPLRPSHNHPRHLPIFVLPMSHNFNFAPTFNPEAFDGHNH